MPRYVMNNIVLCLVTVFTANTYAAPTKINLSGQAHFTVNSSQGKLAGTAPVKGELSIDFNQPKIATGQFKVSAGEMKVSNEAHRDHLRSATWLNTNKCPNITFDTQSSEVLSFQSSNEEGMSTIKLSIEGRMTLNCVASVFRFEKVILKRKGKLSKVGSLFNIELRPFKVYGAEGKDSQINHTMRVTLNLDGK